jgi:hypothetical protein
VLAFVFIKYRFCGSVDTLLIGFECDFLFSHISGFAIVLVLQTAYQFV